VVRSRSLTVGGDVIEVFKGDHSEQVASDLYIKAGKQVVIEGGASFCFKMGGNFITVDTAGVTIKGGMIKINAGGGALHGAAGTGEPPKAPLAAEEGRDKASR
jgi:type VI secretion system secreted protein VgrG